MKPYKRLTPDERDRIAILRSQNKKWREIGLVLGRFHTTLSREWNKNKKKGGYRPHAAQREAEERQKESHSRLRLGGRVQQHKVEQMLMGGWSPETVAGRINFEAQRKVISHEAIYQWIYTEAPHLAEYLTRHHSQRKPRGHRRKKKVRIPLRIPLNQRSEDANNRIESGHWESDLIIGTGCFAIQSTVERVSRKTFLRRIPNKTANENRSALFGIFSLLPKDLRRSITYDNGTENSEHHILNQNIPGLLSFFCEPYHSWEKGAIENRNGLVRRFLPKKTSFDDLTDKELQAIEDWINNRPMKCLGYKTPNEVFNSWLGAIAA
jgi:IS30 family transposase